MRILSKELQHSVRECVAAYRDQQHPLPGITNKANFDSFLLQLFDSIRRVEYVFVLQDREICEERADPTSKFFDPLKAAILRSRSKDVDEACWLVFLATHFGKNNRDGWGLLRTVYGAGWNWNTIKTNPTQFVEWLSKNHHRLSGKFGNHRKYLSLKPQSRAGTSDAFVSYVEWVRPHSSHAQLLQAFSEQSGEDRGALFHMLYESMECVRSFGRMGRFDYLTMLGKLNLYPIEPQSAYIQDSTGPRKGATLLLTGSPDTKVRTKVLEQEVQRLGRVLTDIGVRFSMQVLEDALCNWQKSPDRHERFRG